MSVKTVLFCLLMPALLGLSACSTKPVALSTSPQFAPVLPPAEPTRLATGAIYNGRQSDNWFGQGRAYRVGDIVTLNVDEKLTGSTTQKATMSRDSSTNALPTGLQNYPGGLLAGLPLTGAKTTSEGSGIGTQDSYIKMDISVTVVEVYNNGNLLVRGEKQVAFTDGIDVIQVSGVIRPEDISRDNSVKATRLANAQIAYRGTGNAANAGSPGWGTNLLMKLWPF